MHFVVAEPPRAFYLGQHMMLLPFGPPILVLSAPESVVSCVDAYYEEATCDSRLDALDHSAMLVGQVDRQIRFCDDGVAQDKVESIRAAQKFFQDAAKTYAVQASLRRGGARSREDASSLEVVEWSAWIVNQLKGDYNPVHSHLKFDVTGVAYIRVPDRTTDCSSTDAAKCPDGAIEFIYSTDSKYAPGRHRILPHRGMVLVFPSFLFHAVYPFRHSAEVRRSLSFNAAYAAEDPNAPPLSIGGRCAGN